MLNRLKTQDKEVNLPIFELKELKNPGLLAL